MTMRLAIVHSRRRPEPPARSSTSLVRDALCNSSCTVSCALARSRVRPTTYDSRECACSSCAVCDTSESRRCPAEYRSSRLGCPIAFMDTADHYGGGRSSVVPTGFLRSDCTAGAGPPGVPVVSQSMGSPRGAMPAARSRRPGHELVDRSRGGLVPKRFDQLVAPGDAELVVGP